VCRIQKDSVRKATESVREGTERAGRRVPELQPPVRVANQLRMGLRNTLEPVHAAIENAVAADDVA
jgi:hypothetical protein